MASSSSAADVSITREQLTKYFHLPITDVAKELGICATMLKKICRKNGIPRWPHRKIKSLNKMIESLEASLPNDGSEAGECIRQEIIILKNKKSLIMRNPSILGNSSKRSAEGDELSSSKKQRTDPLQQGPVTTFTNPKASLASTTPNSFSINQLLTPSSNFASPSALVGSAEEKDYRAYAHHHPHLSSIPSSFDASRSDSKHIEGRTSASFPSSLTSYLPEDDPRHLEGSPLSLHPPSTDPYYYHKAALASQYQYHYPRQMLPPSYPPPPHVLSASPHHTRNPYYHPFASHDSPRQQQQHMLAPDATGEQANQQTEQEQDRTQQSQNGHQQTTQQLQQNQHTPKQPQQQMQRLPQSLQQGSESLPKMNLPNTSSDIYKYRNPPSPTTHQQSPYSQGADLGYFYPPQYHSQQRLHQ